MSFVGSQHDSELDIQQSPHGDPLLRSRQPQKQSFCAKHRCIIVTLVVVGVVAVIAAVGVFVGGRSFAQSSITHAGVKMTKLEVSNVKASSFDLHMVGSMDNRAPVGGEMGSTTLSLSDANKEFGQVTLPAQTLPAGASMSLDVKQTVTIVDKAAFTQFGAALLRQKTLTMTMQGLVDLKAMGLSFNGLSMTKSVTVMGAGNFQDPPVGVSGVVVQQGHVNSIVMGLDVAMSNSASMTFADLGVLNFSMAYKGKPVGFCVTDGSVSLVSGMNTLKATATVLRTPSNAALVAELLSRYASGNTSSLTLTGNAQSTKLSLLKGVFQSLNTEASFSGLDHLEDKLFRFVYAEISRNLFSQTDPVNCAFAKTDYFLNVYLYAYNVMNVTFTVDSVDLQVQWDGAPDVGLPAVHLARARNTSTHHVLPPLGTAIVYQKLCIDNDLNIVLQYMNYVINTLHADTTGVIPFLIKVSVAGIVGGSAGDFNVPFAQPLHYAQDHIWVSQKYLC